MSALDEYAMCQPVNFQITEADGRVQIDGGITAGLKTGDRLLVIDGERIPGRILSPELWLNYHLLRWCGSKMI